MGRASYNMAIIMQQDAIEYSLFISANCCKCFGWYLHPSSGAHVTVSTVSGVIEAAKNRITSKFIIFILNKMIKLLVI